MGYQYWKYDKLEALCNDAFQKFGFNADEAKIISDVLLMSDRIGIESHGMQRMYRYYKSIQKGMIKVESKGNVVFETPVSAVIDAEDGMGQVVGHKAMEMAIAKAKKCGIGMVAVRNSNHYGIAGYYAKMACDEGMIGISSTNSQSIMVHTSSKEAILGSNPIAFAMPAEPYPFWFDAATTVVPRGKLEVYNKEGKELNEGWSIDETGASCTDAKHVLECIDGGVAGGILPVGGQAEETGSHKGYGYSMICEILSAIMSGGATSNHHVRAKGQGAGTCHSFIVIDPAVFGDAEEIKAHLSVFLQELRDAKRANANVPIYTHGEKEAIAYRRRMEEGIDVNINTVAEMMRICQALGMDGEAYLGRVDLSGATAKVHSETYQ